MSAARWPELASRRELAAKVGSDEKRLSRTILRINTIESTSPLATPTLVASAHRPEHHGGAAQQYDCVKDRSVHVDRQALDQVVNGVAALFASGGQALRGAQTGRVQNYGLVLFGGMAVIAIALIAGPLLATLVRK